MHSALSLIVHREEAVLLRVLGLVVRRGFEPLHLEAHASPEGRVFTIRMTVEGERSIDGLVRQLVKLNEVKRVDLSC